MLIRNVGDREVVVLDRRHREVRIAPGDAVVLAEFSIDGRAELVRRLGVIVELRARIHPSSESRPAD